jgi:hypothetical protein
MSSSAALPRHYPVRNFIYTRLPHGGLAPVPAALLIRRQHCSVNLTVLSAITDHSCLFKLAVTLRGSAAHMRAAPPRLLFAATRQDKGLFYTSLGTCSRPASLLSATRVPHPCVPCWCSRVVCILLQAVFWHTAVHCSCRILYCCFALTRPSH